jgi:hypothetical protein
MLCVNSRGFLCTLDFTEERLLRLYDYITQMNNCNAGQMDLIMNWTRTQSRGIRNRIGRETNHDRKVTYVQCRRYINVHTWAYTPPAASSRLCDLCVQHPRSWSSIISSIVVSLLRTCTPYSVPHLHSHASEPKRTARASRSRSTLRPVHMRGPWTVGLGTPSFLDQFPALPPPAKLLRPLRSLLPHPTTSGDLPCYPSNAFRVRFNGVTVECAAFQAVPRSLVPPSIASAFDPAGNADWRGWWNRGGLIYRGWPAPSIALQLPALQDSWGKSDGLPIDRVSPKSRWRHHGPRCWPRRGWSCRTVGNLLLVWRGSDQGIACSASRKQASGSTFTTRPASRASLARGLRVSRNRDRSGGVAYLRWVDARCDIIPRDWIRMRDLQPRTWWHFARNLEALAWLPGGRSSRTIRLRVLGTRTIRLRVLGTRTIRLRILGTRTIHLRILGTRTIRLWILGTRTIRLRILGGSLCHPGGESIPFRVMDALLDDGRGHGLVFQRLI